MSRHDVLILGSGVAGLGAGWALGERACILEREERPGGLVLSEQVGAYWFDHVIHLLHLSDPRLFEDLRAIMGDCLQPCAPEAYVECSAGIARYPIQNNLWTLDREVVERCVSDFIAADEAAEQVELSAEISHEELLLKTFGRGLCDLFFFPYQRKMWKRSLADLAPAGFQWNIARPNQAELIRGAEGPRPSSEDTTVYNHNGWYPRPERSSPLRGMELLSRALAGEMSDLRLKHLVTSIDPEKGQVCARSRGQELRFDYETACVSTLPLPRSIALCLNAPDDLKQSVAGLACTRVRSVMLCVKGKRPENSGLWRYFADESLIFTRIVFMSEFDALSAPEDGFGLLVEMTERSEDPPQPDGELCTRVIKDLKRCGWLKPADRVIDSRVLTIDPAYVVFSPGNQEIVETAMEFLRASGIEPLGRYGRWEYSSMASGIADGLAYGASLGAAEVDSAERSVG